ncbi:MULTISPECIES: hypothetical protein [unclassified Embleya]
MSAVPCHPGPLPAHHILAGRTDAEHPPDYSAANLSTERLS